MSGSSWRAAASAVLIGLGAAAGLWAEEAPRYFPPGTWSSSEAFLEGWFGPQLAAMEQEPLWSSRPDAGEDWVLRLLVLPSFTGSTALRVERRHSGEYHWTALRIGGAGGYAPGPPLSKVEGSLPTDISGKLDLALTELGFFAMAAEVRDSDRYCFDGTMYVLEMRRAGDYHAIMRHECEIEGGEPLFRLIWLAEDFFHSYGPPVSDAPLLTDLSFRLPRALSLDSRRFMSERLDLGRPSED